MTRFNSIITLAAVLLFTRLQLFQSSVNALPIQGTTGSGSMLTEADLEPTTVDCSAPTEATQTELEPLLSGLRVLRDYTGGKHDTQRALDHGSGNCPIAVDVNRELTRLFFHSDSLSNSGELIADWYSVFVTYSDYFDSVKNQTLFPADNTTVQTLQHILTAVKQDFLSTLQSLRCNCTSECSIVKKPLNNHPGVSTCADPINSSLNFLHLLTKPAANAVGRTRQQPCCTMSPVNLTDWIEDNIPATSPDYSNVVKFATMQG